MRLPALLAAMLLASAAAAEQPYPTRSIRLVVPFAAGGTADLQARLLGKHLQVLLGQSLIVDARQGGGGTAALAMAAKAPADGHTLLMVSSTQMINETLLGSKPYALMRDFTPVAALNRTALALIVAPGFPAASLAELVAHARRYPGRLNYASTGLGTVPHLAGELLRSMTGIDIVHIPYKNGLDALGDLVGGDVQMMLDVVTTVAPGIRTGSYKALATTGRERSPLLSELPTLAEAGLQDYQMEVLLGFMAPAGTPAPIVERLNMAIGAASRDPELVAAWRLQGATPLALSAADWGRRLNADIVRWAELVAAAHITAN